MFCSVVLGCFLVKRHLTMTSQKAQLCGHDSIRDAKGLGPLHLVWTKDRKSSSLSRAEEHRLTAVLLIKAALPDRALSNPATQEMLKTYLNGLCFNGKLIKGWSKGVSEFV